MASKAKATATTVPDAVQYNTVGPDVDAWHEYLGVKDDVEHHYGPAMRAAVEERQAKMAKDGTWTGKVDGEISPAFVEALRADT